VVGEKITRLIERAIEEISGTIIHESTGKAGTKNSFGEEQIAMDVEADKIMARYLSTNPYVAAYCSEEMDAMGKGTEGGIYSVFHDPIDGSSLFDVNFAVGTIVGIYEGADVMGRTPREQVAALYAVYGPRTTLVLSVGQGVHEFLLTTEGWELQPEALAMRGDKKYFAPGNLRATAEREDYLKLVNWYIKEKYTLRYSGGMVPDVHHMFKKGSGVFIYPGMPSAPEGKLRILYECGPMAYLMEQAGGASSNGEVSILDVKITGLTQRTPIYLGTPEEVKRVESFLKQ
jgi:fructose-1,6-bisphosphatase I